MNAFPAMFLGHGIPRGGITGRRLSLASTMQAAAFFNPVPLGFALFPNGRADASLPLLASRRERGVVGRLGMRRSATPTYSNSDAAAVSPRRLEPAQDGERPYASPTRARPLSDE